MKELIYGRSLLASLRRSPDSVAVRDRGGYTATYAEHVDRVGRAAEVLRSNDWSRFGVVAYNGHRFLELWHAALLGAGVIVPLNYRLAVAELTSIVLDAEVDVVFVDEANRALVVEALAPLAEDRPAVVLLDESDETGYESRLEAARPTLPAEPEEDEPVALMYTGGTTGRPKAAVMSHRAEVLNMYHQHDILSPDDSTVFLHQSPMFHGAAVYGILNPLARGGQVCFLERFEPLAVVEAVEEYGVTATQMGPTMITMLLDQADSELHRMGTLTQLTYGTAPMTRGLLARLREKLPNVRLFNGYGMTEAASALAYLRHEEHLVDNGRLLTSVGRPLMGVDIAIRGASGATLPPGEVGEICARAGNFMTEYWRRPEETAAAFQGGWYHTGDLGYLDEDGYLFVVDRLKDMIVTGGENVYSAEVENALSAHPAVAQCAVIGLPHERWGEQVHAIVVQQSGTAPTAEELDGFLRDRLAGYKIPKSWEIQSQPLPVSGAMKILKREIRAARVSTPA